MMHVLEVDALELGRADARRLEHPHETAPAQDAHAARVFALPEQVVRRHQHRRAPVAEPAHGRRQLVRRLRIEPRGGLVEQEHAALARHRQRERHLFCRMPFEYVPTRRAAASRPSPTASHTAKRSATGGDRPPSRKR